MKITTVGIDLAKNVFQVRGVDERGKTVLRVGYLRYRCGDMLLCGGPLPVPS